jgi:CheY-like chemotaxis protein
MPGVSAFDFISQGKKDPAMMTTTLIVYSGSELQRDIYRAYSLGPNSYLVKAMTLETMTRRLVNYWLETASVVDGIGSALTFERDSRIQRTARNIRTGYASLLPRTLKLSHTT